MGKRKAKQGAKGGPKVGSSELTYVPTEAPPLNEPTAGATGAAAPGSSQEVPNSNVAPQGVTWPNRYQLPTSPVEVNRPIGPTYQEEAVETVYVDAESSEVANQFWLLLERAGYEVW